jgi:S-adenosylmethionine:tRNA ribosyltransferase-isomerase
LLKEVQVISSAQRFKPGSILPLMGGAQFAVQGVIQGGEEYTHYRGVLHFPEAKPTTLEAYLNTWGELPLPPYLNRPALPQDRQDYQTSYASNPGSIAAPTAGLHFSPALLHHLAKAEIELLRVTLHIGYGTFRTFSTATIEEHHMDPEYYSVSKETALSLWRALREGRRVIAVGTTSARTLETVADTLRSDVPPKEDLVGESRLFIYPPFTFRVLSGLITNFHYPRTSVLALTAAMCGGRDILIDTIYQEALTHDYLWFSYGDGMLIC